MLLCVFAAEMILGGPGFWGIGGISFRKVLFAANCAWFMACWLWSTIRLTRGEIACAMTLVAIMVVWIAFIPATRKPTQLAFAVQDGLPLAMGLLGLLFRAYFRQFREEWPRLKRVTAVALVFTALMNIALWVVGMTGDAGNFAAQAAALAWFTLGRIDLSPPLYIGAMPDGFFRAMWITGTLYMPALLYCIARRRWAGAALFSFALLATYTRSLWLATVLGILIAQLTCVRGDRMISPRILAGLAVFIATLGAVAFVWVSRDADIDLLSTLGKRIGTVFSDSSAEERYEQVGPLISAWTDAPLFGKGFGASASIVRSEEAPFSYEVTVLALLMKMGAVGLIAGALLVCGIWLVHALPARTLRTRDRAAGLGAAVAFLAAAATNPFLINFVGMSLMSYLFIRIQADGIGSHGN